MLTTIPATSTPAITDGRGPTQRHIQKMLPPAPLSRPPVPVQWDGYKDSQPQIFILAHPSPLKMAFFSSLSTMEFKRGIRRRIHFEDTPYVYDDKWDRNQIANDGGQTGGPYRQAGSYASGDASPQLHPLIMETSMVRVNSPSLVSISHCSSSISSS